MTEKDGERETTTRGHAPTPRDHGIARELFSGCLLGTERCAAVGFEDRASDANGAGGEGRRRRPGGDAHPARRGDHARLFFCRYPTTAQIAAPYYNPTRRASPRLSQLKKKEALDNRLMHTLAPTGDHPGKREAVWHLTKGGFEVIARSLDHREEG